MRLILFSIAIGLLASTSCPKPTPIPTPIPTPSPDPIPTPTPDPTPSPVEYLIPDEELTVQNPQDNLKLTWNSTWDAINRYKAEKPQDWNTEQTCLSNGPAGIDNAFHEISYQLGKVDITAGQSITKSGQRSDCIFVASDSIRYEESHLFDYARACVATGPNAIKGTYLRTPPTGGIDPVPTPPPTCKPPMPLRAYEDGNPHWFLTCKPWGGSGADIKDCTPKVQGQPDFCEEVFGVRNLNCELGPEANADRECREKYLYGTTFVESRDGAICTRLDNPMQFSGHNGCRLCGTQAPIVCSDWF